MNKEWIVPLVVFIVWLVNTIIKNREKQEMARPKVGGAGGNRNSSNEIDKFLQEIDRLRKKPEPSAPVPQVKPVIERPSAASQPRQAAMPPMPAPRKPVPRARPVQRVAASRAMEPMPELIVVAATEQPEPLPQPLPMSGGSSQTGKPGSVSLRLGQMSETKKRGETSVASRNAMQFLRNPQSLASVMILQTILGEPRCRGRRPRG